MDKPKTVELDLKSFSEDIALRETIRRTRDELLKLEFSDDIRGYFLENNIVERALYDGSGILTEDEQTNKNYAYFRPAVTLVGKDLKLYTVDPSGSRGGNTRHATLPTYQAAAWVFCDVDSFDKKSKRCHFTPYSTVTAQYVEEQYASGRKNMKFSLKINERKVDYIVKPTDDPEVFIQERVSDPTINRYVLRIPNDEAREMQIKRELRALAPKRSDGRALLDVLLQTNLDISQYDALYESDEPTYKSVNYGILLQQRDVFNDNYGTLTRAEAYHIMSDLKTLDSEIIIRF